MGSRRYCYPRKTHASSFALTHSWKDEVCYGALGCFSLRPPWVTLLRPVPPPNTPDEIDAKFYLYTR